MTKIIHNSSQPYLFKDGEIDKMLYCYANKSINLKFGDQPYSVKPWKIYSYNIDNSESFVVNTIKSHKDLGNVIIECNPQIIVSNNYIKIYYTAGFMESCDSPIVYYLCSFIADNTNFHNIRDFQIVQKTFSGTVSNNNLIFIEKELNQDRLMIKNLDTNRTNTINSNLDMVEILRVSSVFNSDKIIVTAKDFTRKYVSYLLNSDFSLNRIVTNNQGYDIYKCSISNNLLAYTIHNYTNDNLTENRSIVIENI